MYARSPKNNINLVELMQQGKAIFFKMPQSRFSSAISKNILVSYLGTWYRDITIKMFL